MDRGRQFEDAEPTAQRGPQPPVSRAPLTLAYQDALGSQLARVSEEATLGSAPGVTVRVVHPTVSRIHARIERRPDGSWLVDLESTHGTSVNDVAVSGARLTAGARVRLGSVELAVGLEGDAAEVPLWPTERFGPLVARSVSMRELFHKLDRIAASEGTVVITGETGTGKDVVARALHEASARRGGPFVVVDCGAIPEALFEAELFGHTRGAFTGADHAREGAFAAAEGGTLLLDEVGELPLSLQPKLLRVLETRSVKRIGESSHRAVDVRIVAATHRDLARLVSTGGFREDLFFRLAVLPIHVPPLRERKEDVDVLVSHFLRGATSLDPATMEEARARPWLGNVRELRNFVERASALGATEALRSMPTLRREPNPLPPVDVDEPFKEARDRWLNHLERTYLAEWLEKQRWNVSAVAEAMGLDRSYVHRLMRKHGLVR